jgi:C6 transcription factor Pro1
VLHTSQWFDIFASITDLHPPRFLPLYRRLFAGGAGFWARRHSPAEAELAMEALAGCPDEAMLAIAEVSALAHWKAQEQQSGTLSVRELIRRGDAIEQQLRRPDAVVAAGSPPGVTLPERRGSLPGPGPPPPQAFPSEEMRRIAAEIYREAVILYLHTVLSDSHPGARQSPLPHPPRGLTARTTGVPEIMQQVAVIARLLGQLPPSELDRSLVFPLCFAGCMADDGAQRVWLKSRMDGHKDTVGNVYQIKAVMDRVWQRRDAHGGPVDWRDVMREQGWSLLLV